ncbi:hypothetical protein [Mesorhizobium sp. B1-1-8]|uniref:hypothetical protein n=1 Tax=Mesorhizobium sp. B1-1-8 TaxID=2589976 RepID=UPI00112CACF9|nr:hypothetical protein [Mesorhizobium sp. B1-1-8]UCI10471.1 hypothetical protein FJ974_29630 [Mesorhizobium sp. B1-1-8]
MDRAYANALKRKQELEFELARIDSFLDMYRQFGGPEGEQIEPLVKESSGTGNKETLSPRQSRRLRPPEIADLAERVIRGAGHPLTRAEIVARLESAGIELHSEDKPRYIGTILWREKERFTNIAGQGYVMADMATPEGNVRDLIDRATDEEPDVGKEKGAFE